MSFPRFICLMLIIFATFEAQNQEVISTAGSHISSANGSNSWTIGEVVIFTNLGTDGVVTQGIHQPSVAAAPIPTMGTWAIIISYILILIFGIIYFQNQVNTQYFKQK